MTNLEKYYDKLTDSYGVNKKTEKVISCKDLRCIECIFDTEDGKCLNNLALKWLNKEYKEPYKITSEELAFCNMVHTGYLWRDEDKNNTIFYFKKRPRKSSFGDYATDFENTAIIHPYLFPSFNCIAEDELISIEDILSNYSIVTE